MKATVIFVFIVLFLGCQNCPSIDQDNADFVAWSDALTITDVKAMYESGASFMSDVRVLPTTAPFSYKDSIISTDTVSPPVSYPYTRLEGTTTVYYSDSLIFHNSWNNYYMDGVSSITTVEYGELDGFKLLRITNESNFPANQKWPNGYYRRENRLFIENNNILSEIDLKSYYALGEVRGSSRDGVIILYSFDFVRSASKYQYLILFDLSSKKSKVFKFEYD